MITRPAISILSKGRIRSLPLEATRNGKTITLRASASAVKEMRAAVRAKGHVTASVIVTGTSSDGVVDTAAIAWTFR